MTAAPTFAFVKGHGTQNDFVVLDDPGVRLGLTEDLVSALCDRQRGIGADGVLRVATAGALMSAGVLTALPDGVASDDWFMDYRNADGSIAEMCGNGVRVFAHYLRVAGHVDADTFTVGSRAGGRPVVVHSVDDSAADVSVAMGHVALGGPSEVEMAGRRFTGERVDVGNPHLACVVDGLTAADLAGLDFSRGAILDQAAFPRGANVEILTPLEPSDAGVDFTAQMRVLERGVGETRSCGTGLVAAAGAALHGIGRDQGVVGIAVPGGSVVVTVGDNAAVLRGPSRLVARGETLPGWIAG
ncbi:diaminopimelate epimerase [Gordonia sp. HY002]|uniref:diaminopimelate epimerase n=1 Tax=Gordonia zhenghanii TaxID=2911516 RepID=UPI001EF0DD11|nr:diaminopimelate epimerase [Gordonia zhenghanii]MCF8569636.1 diaminopimelate epimerase [Gordonia zhenghanii]MCF8602843.1 diaminopimelate epimerase [Gordonia zhenghanii]